MSEHDELVAIHKVCMCIAEVEESLPSDTHTVRKVKEMAVRINKSRAENERFRKALESISTAYRKYIGVRG